jgi:hypothetical protein
VPVTVPLNTGAVNVLFESVCTDVVLTCWSVAPVITTRARKIETAIAVPFL